MVAEQRFRCLRASVEGQRCSAAIAAHHVAATPALDDPRTSSPVQEEDGLFTGLHDLVQSRCQRTAEHAAIARAKLVSHVHNLDLRQACLRTRPLDPRRQHEVSEGPALCRIRRLQDRSGAAEHRHCTSESCELPSDVPCVVTRGAVHLLVRPLVLLV